ncbi:MAG: PadR family transcriptional regulator [Eubacteriales bacterium]
MAKENKTLYAILGMLSHEDLTGYDIKKRIDNSIRFFWDAGFGQIYPNLKILEKEGMVTKTVEAGEHRPNRIVYAITEKGREDLKKWLAAPVGEEHVRYEILLKLFFGSLLPAEQNIKKIEDFRDRNRAYLETMQGFKSFLQDSLKESEDHLYYLLTVLLGENIYRAHVEWADEAIKLLQNKFKFKDG